MDIKRSIAMAGARAAAFGVHRRRSPARGAVQLPV